jgi:excisionase family DNA binding protein
VAVPEERFLSTEEVAERLQVDEQTVRRWIKSGKLEAFKPGREWRISPAAFEALLESYSSPKAETRFERFLAEARDKSRDELVRRNIDLADRLKELAEDPAGLPRKLGGQAHPGETGRHLRELAEAADEAHAVAQALAERTAKEVSAIA